MELFYTVLFRSQCFNGLNAHAVKKYPKLYLGVFKIQQERCQLVVLSPWKRNERCICKAG